MASMDGWRVCAICVAGRGGDCDAAGGDNVLREKRAMRRTTCNMTQSFCSTGWRYPDHRDPMSRRGDAGVRRALNHGCHKYLEFSLVRV